MADVIGMPSSSQILSSSSSSSLLTVFSSSLNSLQPVLPTYPRLYRRVFSVSHSTSSANNLAPCCLSRSRKQLRSLKVHATVTETHQPKWWEKNAGPNMVDIHSSEEFSAALSQAGDRLVIVEFYGTWCASCRALFPKLCRTAALHPEILFLKVNFDENKPMCKELNVKVLPYFHFYRGAGKQLESFSCSLAKFQKIKDGIELHSTTGYNLNSPKVINLNLEAFSMPKDDQTGSSSA